jgi:hypothetical protein
MVASKSQNPMDEFICHGIKTVGSYDYFLMVDATGKCYIERVAADDSTYRYNKMSELPISTSFANIATAIDAYWAAPETHVYKYLFQCK